MTARTIRIGIILVLMSALPLTSHAQLHVTSLKAVRKDLGSEGKYSFPLVSGGAPDVAARINNWLQTDQLKMEPGHSKASPFENVWPAPGSWQGVDSLSYKIVADTPGYLSLLIQGEGMGAHSSESDAYYNFDAGTGVHLQLDDLFTPQGLKAFEQRVRKARLKRIDNFLARLPKPSGTAKPVEGSDEDTVETQRQLYTGCRGSVAEDDFRYNDLSLEAKQLVVIREHCAPHVIQAVDDIWDFRNAYPFAALRDQLNAYGRCLLIDRRDDCGHLHGAPLRGALFGTMGGHYRITFYLGADTDVSSYAYDKVGRFIHLAGGRQADGTYRFTEQFEGGHKAVFVLKRQTDGLAGSWTQDGTGKTMSVVLH